MFSLIVNMAKYKCLHCKRDNFKTQGGLKQHLKNHAVCSKLEEIRAIKINKHNDQSAGGTSRKLPTKQSQFTSDNVATLPQTLAQLPIKRSNMDQQYASSNKRSAKSKDNEQSDLRAAQKEVELRLQKQALALETIGELGASEEDIFFADEDDMEEVLNLDNDESEGEEFDEVEEVHMKVNGEPLQQFKEYVAHARQHFLKFDKHEKKAIKLMDILRRKKASLDTYDAIMEWHYKETGALKEHQTLGAFREYLSRHVMISRLAKRYNKDYKNLINNTEIVLPSSRIKARMIWHKARDAVVSLLTDPRIEDDDYLFFDNDPLAPPPEDFDYLCDINTGSSYRLTYKRLITKPGKQVLVPIIMYIDGTVTDAYSKLELQALILSLGIFKSKTRDKNFAWRKLGYVPNITKEDSRGNKIYKESGHIAASNLHVSDGEGEEAGLQEKHQVQDFHSMLSFLLESYRELEKESLLWDLNYRGKLYKDVEFVFYVAFVKCDNDEGDKLCGQYRGRSLGCATLCRYCLCPTMQMDDPLAKYPYKTEPMISRLVANGREQDLQKMSQQYIENAFYGIRFGLHNKRGIHGATPLELLHSILLGLFMRVREQFFSQIGPKSECAEEINSLAKLYGQLFTRQSDRDLPHTYFSKGIQKGKIHAKEYTGVLLIMAAILQSTAGRGMLSTKKANFGEKYLIDDWVMLVETMLEWEAFLKLDKMEMKHVKRLEKKHRYIMYLFKKIGNRTKGNGQKTMKFHGISHMYEDMVMYGVCMNVDTGSNETGHKESKVAAKLTQHKISAFETQTDTRLEEFHLIDLALAEINGDALWEYFDEIIPSDNHNNGQQINNTAQNPDNTGQMDIEDTQKDAKVTGGATIVIKWEDGWEEPEYSFLGSGIKDQVQISWDKHIIKYLYDVQVLLMPHVPNFKIRTEHRRNGQIFRGHPSYRQKMWNDWVIVDWGGNEGQPSEIWCFLDLTSLKEGVVLQVGEIVVEKGVYAVIESADYLETLLEREEDEDNADAYRAQHETQSDLFRPIFKEVQMNDNFVMARRKFYLADVEAFLEPIVVVPDVGSEQVTKYFQVLPRREWSTLFTKWVEQPHHYDEMDAEEKEEEEE